jgi:hypothetical protein
VGHARTRTVACWGDDGFGQASAPYGTFDQVSAGWGNVCGARVDGTVAYWGWDDYGQSTPPGDTFTQVSADGHHTCGVRTDGMVACWGASRLPPNGLYWLPNVVAR